MPHYDRLAHLVYVLEHNPEHKPSYLIRLARKGTQYVDCLPHSPELKTTDQLFFGRTLDEAVDAALGIKKPPTAEPPSHFISNEY